MIPLAVNFEPRAALPVFCRLSTFKRDMILVLILSCRDGSALSIWPLSSSLSEGVNRSINVMGLSLPVPSSVSCSGLDGPGSECSGEISSNGP